MIAILRSKPAAGLALSHASMSTFAGQWGGHGRSLTITKSGTAHESINDGCCDHVIDIYFTLHSPSGTTSSAKIHARITRVKVSDPHGFPDPPQKGQKTQFKLRNGVITEPLTKTTYCDAQQTAVSTCGA